MHWQCHRAVVPPAARTHARPCWHEDDERRAGPGGSRRSLGRNRELCSRSLGREGTAANKTAYQPASPLRRHEPSVCVRGVPALLRLRLRAHIYHLPGQPQFLASQPVTPKSPLPGCTRRACGRPAGGSVAPRPARAPRLVMAQYWGAPPSRRQRPESAGVAKAAGDGDGADGVPHDAKARRRSSPGRPSVRVQPGIGACASVASVE